MLETNASREQGLSTCSLDSITVLTLVESWYHFCTYQLKFANAPSFYNCLFVQLVTGRWERESARLHLIKIHSLHWAIPAQHEAPVHHDDLDGWDGEGGRDFQEGGDICKHVAESFHFTAEANTTL